jgi:hypothetical protein
MYTQEEGLSMLSKRHMTFNNIGKKEIQGMYFKWQTLKILQVQNL